MFGHNLDIMFRPIDDIGCQTTVSQLLSSDHYCVVCDLFKIILANNAEPKQLRNLHCTDLKTFKTYISVNFTYIMQIFRNA